MNITAVYACVRILSEAIAGLPLHTYKHTKSGGKEKAVNHPLYFLLHDEPNPEMTSFVFRETLMSHLLLWGNAYSQVIRNGRGDVLALYPLAPNRMTVDRLPNGKIYYIYSPNDNDNPKLQNKGQVYLKKEDVLHIPGLGFNGLIGYSPIAMAKNAIGMAMACEKFGAKFFANGANPSGVLEHPGTIKDPEKLRESWNSLFQGSSNSHRIAILEEGLKYQPISISPNEAQFLETRKFQLNEIARIFRIPPHMIGGLEKSSFSNIEQQSLEFVKYTLDPWVMRWEQAIHRSLFKDSEKRDYFVKSGFKEMISDALSGKIDLIITKSVSRFARNTVDTLTTVRKLKDKGIEVYFEKENIYTFDAKGELLLTIMSSLAQEESRSISENVTWGHRKRFAEGKIIMPYSNFLGYEKGEDGLPKIVPTQAKIVKLIYKLFLDGKTPCGICKYLESKEILSPMGKKKWSKTTVLSILQNEKYKGDALLQKQYTVNFLTKKQKKNNGEVPQYYVEGSHEAIIEPEVFDLVQAEIKERKKQGLSNSGNSVFSSRIVCSKCGKFYGPRTFHSTDKYKRVVWQCKSKLKKGHKCETLDLNPKDIENIFIEAFNKLLENKDEVIGGIKEFIKSIDDTEVMEKEKAKLCGESRLIYTKIQNYIDKNATETLDQDTYKENYIKLSNEYEAVKQKIEVLDSKLKDKRARIIAIENFLKDISENETLIDSFDDKLFIRVIDKITVKSYTEVIVVFKNGQEVPMNIKK